MNDTASSKPIARKRSRGWLWKLPVALVVLLVVLVALLPTLVSWGLANGFIRSAIEKNVNGSVNLSAVSVSWFGEQTVKELTITAPNGTKAVDVTATLHASLLDVLFGGMTAYDVDLAGEVNGELREDNTLSFADIVKKNPQPAQPGPTSTSQSRVPDVNVNITSLRGSLLDVAHDQTITLNDVTGTLTLAPGKTAELKLQGATNARDHNGSFAIEAHSGSIISAAGEFTPVGTNASFAMALRNVPALFSDTTATIHEFLLNANSDDLASRIEITMNGKATVEGEHPSSLTGGIAVEHLFDSNGKLTFNIDAITGSITGTRVPISLLQPVLASVSVIRIDRDLGSMLDVNANFSAGESKRIEVQASTDYVMANLAGNVNIETRSLDFDHVEFIAEMHPTLAKELAGVQLFEPRKVIVEMSKLSVPGAGADGSLNLGAIAMTGKVHFDESFRVKLPGESPRTISISDAVVNVESPAIGTQVRAFGTATVDDLTIGFDESVSNLIDSTGAIAFDKLVPVGSVRIAGINDATVQSFAPEIADLVIANKVLPASAELRTRAEADGWSADITLAGNKLDALATARRTGDELLIELANFSMRLSPALMAALQQGNEHPIELLGPVQMQLSSDAISLDATDLAKVDVMSLPLRLYGEFPEIALANLPALDEPVRIKAFDANLTARMKPERSLRAVGEASIQLANDDAPLTSLNFDIGLADVNGELAPTGMLELNELSIAAIERASGRDAGALSSFVGPTGNIQLTLERSGDTFYSNVNAALTNLNGRFSAALSPTVLELDAETSRFVISKDGLNRFLARATVEQDASSQSALASLRATSDLPLDAKVKSLRVPITAIMQEPVDPSLFDIDIALTGGPVSFNDPKLGTLTSQSIVAAVTSTNFAQGVNIDVNVTALSDRSATTAEASELTRLTMKGSLANLLDAESRIATKDATLTMKVEAEHIPTAVVDAAGSFSGLLVAALGPQVKFRADAETFSLSTGKLTSRLDAPNGWMEGILKGRDGLMQLSVNNPLRAELQITPELRDRLLYKIHPILADIRTTEQPMRVLVPNASIPANGDVSKLNARIEITVGKVELDGGSTTLFLLKLFNSKGTAIPGSIDPIVANIVNGVLTYEKFSMHIDKYRMDYTGMIDLNTGAVNLRTELPLEALASNINELRGYTDNLVVPIVTQGSFGNLKTQIDPKFDFTKAAIKSGLGGALGDLLGGKKNNETTEGENKNDAAPKTEDQVGDILDAILRGVGRSKNQTDESRQGAGRGGSRQNGK